MVRKQEHNASAIFDLGFITGGQDRAKCLKCGRVVQLGTRGLGVYYASVHRMRCDR